MEDVPFGNGAAPSATDSPHVKQARAPFVSALLRAAPLLLLLGFIWAVVSVFQARSATVEREIALAYRTGAQHVPVLFGKLEQTTYAPDGLAMRWKGANATILHVRTTTREHSGLFVSPYMGTTWQVLAKTSNGRYFLVEYRVDRSPDAELKARERIHAGELRPVGESGLKYFLSADPKDDRALAMYREMFHQEPPPQEIDA